MAGIENQAESDFREILTILARNFDIILVKWLNDRDFEVRIRTEIDRDNDDFNGLCDQWVDQFSTVTNTVWVKKISNTGPKIRFRKQYQCWTHGGNKVQKELLFDANRCRAVLDMKVLTDTPLTRRKNKHIRMGLNAVVKINFNHLHPVNKEEPFAFFVHTCPPQPDQSLPPPPSPQPQQPILVQPTPVLPIFRHPGIITTPITITNSSESSTSSADLSDALLICQPNPVFDATTLAL